ncbi:unnamed protein product [Dicrocoelium dendriticum]|nr:unnamed protein product [Dicrocoelium dendriticum]
MNSNKASHFYSPAPLHAATMFPESSFAAGQFFHGPAVLQGICNDCGDCVSSFPSKSPGWTGSQPSYRQQLSCPRCSAWCFATNWCTNCGELLLGSDLRPSDPDDCITNCATLGCEKMPPPEPITSASDEQCKGFPPPSLGYSPTHQRCFQTTSSPPAYSHDNAANIAMRSSINDISSVFSDLTHDFTNGGGALSPAATNRCNQLYYLIQARVSSDTAQLEALRSNFNVMSLQPGSLTTLGDLTSESPSRRGCSVPLVTWGPELYSEDIQTGSAASRFCRQRCVSGPVSSSSWSEDCRLHSEHRTAHLIPAAHQVVNYDSFIHPVSLSLHPGPPFSIGLQNIWWPLTQEIDKTYSSNSFQPHFNHIQGAISPSLGVCNQFTCCPVSQPEHFTKARRKSKRNYRRLKYLSECSQTPPDAFVIFGNDTAPSSNTHIPSTDSDFHQARHAIPTTASHGPNQRFCSWPSSRPVWLAHDSFLTKTKRSKCTRSGTFVSRVNQTRRKNPHDRQRDHGLGSSHPNELISKQEETCSEYPVPEESRDADRLDLVNSTAPVLMRAESSCIHSSNSEASAELNLALDDQPTWSRLPDELWLRIIEPLPTADRARLALTCRRLSHMVVDRSLWRVIQLHRRQHLDNTALASIGRLRPRELHLSYCHGDKIAEENLRQLFRACGSELKKLSFVGCTKGLFDGDLTLLLAAEHCPNLSHIDASYTQSVRDHTVIALARSLSHLTSLKLNGARQISNTAIEHLVQYRESTLQRLELFGCFRLNSDIFTLLGRCQQLRALAFGHLYHLSSDGLLELVSKLPLLASLDLRGTQALANDSNLTRLADKCPHLEEVVLANMRSLKHEAGIAQMLRRLPRLRVLDLCGLAAVGDLTMEALATCCPCLEELDVSCTSITHKGLSYLIETPAKCLRCLRISRCREITEDVLEKLVQACSRLTLLYAYDFKSIKDWSFLQKLRPTILIESDC